MTYIKDVFGRDLFKDFDKVFVGFDDQFNRIAKMHDDLTKHIPNYPPYNIKKVDEGRYLIEIAVAGFSQEEIEIEYSEDKLVVRGNAKESDETHEWLYKGIATRNFTRTFVLNDQVEVKGAALVNGMLQIGLERIIPEHKKSRKVEITSDALLPKKTFLVEDTGTDD
jgi:molecular chaperone IbpA